MRSGILKFFSIVFLVLSLAPVAARGATGEQSVPAPITVTDMAGRQVSVTVPVRKVVLGYAKHLPSLAAVAGDDFAGKIAGWGLSRTVLGQGIFVDYQGKFPEIEAIPDVGSHAQGTFSVERVIALKPDAVIFPLWMINNKYEGIADDIAKMAMVGIPTVFIDCWEKPLANTVPSIVLLGTLLGKEPRAREIAAFYQERLAAVTGRLEKIKAVRPRVYVENGSRGPAEYGWTCGNYAWGAMVAEALGSNIAEGIVKRWGQINPEYLLKTDPEVILLAEPKGGGSSAGAGLAGPEESRKLLAEYTRRQGWDTFSAVKNGRVHGVFDSFIIYNIYNFAAIEAIAKWLYPEEFRDLDPEAGLREFYRRFLSAPYKGEWMIGMAK